MVELSCFLTARVVRDFRRANDPNIWNKFTEHGASITAPSNSERREFVGISSSVINLFIHKRERHRDPHASLCARTSYKNVVSEIHSASLSCLDGVFALACVILQ